MVGTLALAALTLAGAWQWRAPRVHAPMPSKVPEANEYFQRAMLFLNAQMDLPRARQMLEKALALDPGYAHARAWYGFTHALLIDSGQSNDTSNVAEFYAVLGERAKALEWLDRAVRAGDQRAELFERDPLLVGIRAEPRFRQVVDGIRYRRERANREAS